VTGDSPTGAILRPENDPADMKGRVLGFPDQLRAARDAAVRGPDLLGNFHPTRVYVVGMGGSAIGGDFLRTYAEVLSTLPVEVVRGYELPRAADDTTAALFVSYSGGTEETLTAWEEAGRREVRRACITSGGELAARAEAAGVPVLRIPGGMPPRSALGWTSVPLFQALAREGRLPFEVSEVEEAARACEAMLSEAGPGGSDPAVRRWAEAAKEALILIHAPAARLGAVATRWACQINENGKSLAHVALFPEHNHNEIVGWEVTSALHRSACVAFLTDDRVHPRVHRRMEIVAEMVERSGGRATWFRPKGEGLLARLYSLAVLGDLASLYLAAARGVDPTPVASIDRLKSRLAAETTRE
jgi:glucose/mannose-6-phosphate isomerase